MDKKKIVKAIIILLALIIGIKVFCIDNKLTFTSFERKSIKAKETALKKITDQDLLARITLEDSNGHIRGIAVSKITDQGLLVEIAMGCSCRSLRPVRIVAVNKIADQLTLTDIAINAQDSYVKTAATYRITNPHLLEKIDSETFSFAAEEILKNPKAARNPAPPIKLSAWFHIKETIKKIGLVIGAICFIILCKCISWNLRHGRPDRF